MPSPAKKRRFPLLYAALLCAAASVRVGAQPGAQAAGSGLPALPPTGLPAPISATSLPGSTTSKSRKATVTYAAGLLNVRANNSSLNSILREISRLTGMTITGGVADQRVFGDYGPAEPSTVLATLLDGTGTNLFLKESTESAPAELVLTPRNGGATPPSPTSAQYNNVDEASEPVSPGAGSSTGLPGSVPGSSRSIPGYAQVPPTATQQAPAAPFSSTGATGATSGPVPVPPPLNNPLGDPNAVSPTASTLPVTNSVPADSLPTPSTAQPVSGIVDAPSAPPANSTTAGYSDSAAANAASPTTPTDAATDTTGPAVRTPEQIFQQLQQLRQSAQSSQAGTGGTPTTPGPATKPPQE